MISKIRRRIGRKDNSSFIGLDSFMDIVTNVMGALFFVIIYVALSASLAKGKETLPLAREADTERVIFECRANTAFYPEFEEMLEKISKLEEKNSTQDTDIKIENAFYTYKQERKFTISNMYIIQYYAKVFTPKPNSKGEDATQIEKENSKFQRELKKFDPEKHHILFIVRTDSFPVFHTARRIADKKGFKIGWEPYETDKPITFAPYGEYGKVQ